MNANMVGIVLAGGQSQRFGRDKALAALPTALHPGFRGEGLDKAKGKTLLAWTVQRLTQCCPTVLLAMGAMGDPKQLGSARRAEVEALKAEFPDRLKLSPDGPIGNVAKGPAAGLLGASSDIENLLVLACDLPLVRVSTLQSLITRSGDLVIPKTTNGLEPLCALYRRPALNRLLSNARAGRYALHRLADDDSLVTQVEAADEREFLNVNHLDDFKQLSQNGLG